MTETSTIIAKSASPSDCAPPPQGRAGTPERSEYDALSMIVQIAPFLGKAADQPKSAAKAKAKTKGKKK